MPAPAYDVRCSLLLLEEGRLPLPSAVAPQLVPKPKKTNPPWVRAIRAFGNTACVLFIVFILGFILPRSRDKNHLRLFFNCAIPVLLSLGFPVMAYILTMDVDDQPQGACNA